MPSVRVFISIPVPDPAPLKSVTSGLQEIGGIRIAPDNQMHLTLKFIGDIDSRRIPEISGAVRKAAETEGPFEIVLKEAGAFPKERSARIVWVGAEPAGILGRISGNIGAGLGSIPYDKKPFKSHITVGRCRDPLDLSSFLGGFRGKEFLRFECREILVMKSELSRSGAKHSVLDRIPLGNVHAQYPL